MIKQLIHSLSEPLRQFLHEPTFYWGQVAEAIKKKRKKYTLISTVEPGSILLERFEIVRLIGQGAMGWCLEALDRELDDERVALKILFPQLVSDAQVVERLRKEVILTRQLSHPCIVRTYDMFCDPHYGHFISMECVSGWSLMQILKEGYKDLGPDLKARILFSIAQALSFAHRRGVLHRDLRPGNVLIGKSGEIKLSDFSFARLLESDSGLTATGEIVGSPSYMSPEQLLGSELDCQSDVYSFGILAFELYSGSLPWEATSYIETARLYTQESVPALETRVDGLQDWVYEVVNTACKRTVKERYASGVELLKSMNESAASASQTLTEIRIPSLEQGRGGKRIVRRASLLFLLCIVCWLIMVLLSQRVARNRAAPLVLQLEYSLGLELRPLKRFFQVEASLFNQQSILESISRGDTHSTRALIQAGANLGVHDEDGNTFLHQLKPFNLENVRIQPDRLPLNVQNDRGQTPINFAVKNGLNKQVRWLLQYPQKLGTRDASGNAAIHNAVLRRNVPALKAIAPYANLDQLTLSGNAAIHLAIQSADTELLSLLLRLGANPNLRDAEGRSPLLLALANQTKVSEHLELLLAHGADSQAFDNQGRGVGFYIQQINPAARRNELLQQLDNGRDE